MCAYVMPHEWNDNDLCFNVLFKSISRAVSKCVMCCDTHPNFFPSLAVAPGYCSVMVFLAYVCSFLSAWFVVLMMAERYIAVCHPFRASALCNKRKSLMVIAGLSVFSVLLYSTASSRRSSRPRAPLTPAATGSSSCSPTWTPSSSWSCLLWPSCC